MTVTNVFEGEDSRIGKIITTTKKIQEIDSAISVIRYNDELYASIPDVVSVLNNGREALVAELKTL